MAIVSGFLGTFGFRGDATTYEQAVDAFCRNDDVLTQMRSQHAQSIREVSVALAGAYVECIRAEQGFHYWATVNPDNPKIFSITARFVSAQQGAVLEFMTDIDVFPVSVRDTCSNRELFARNAQLQSPSQVSMTCRREVGEAVQITMNATVTPSNTPVAVPVIYQEELRESIEVIYSDQQGTANAVGPGVSWGPQRCVSAPQNGELIVDGQMALNIDEIWEHRDGQGRVGYASPHERVDQRDSRAFCGALGTRPQCGAECRYNVTYRARARLRTWQLQRTPR